MHTGIHSFAGFFRGGMLFFACGSLLAPLAQAQQGVDADLGSSGGWQRYDWLSPAGTTTTSSNSSASTTAAASTPAPSSPAADPFAVAASDSLWQQKYGATYAKPIVGDLSLTCETSGATLNQTSNPVPGAGGVSDDLAQGEKAGLQYQEGSAFNFGGNVHDSSDDAGAPSSAVDTRGGGLTAGGHLPTGADLTLGANWNTITTGTEQTSATDDDSCDAQIKQPLGKLPLTAVMKGHFEETSQNGATTSRLPSLEQSLVWKVDDATSLQMGLRQQKYQNFPGIDNQLNEALFADWSETLVPEITWHSYAEVLSNRSTQDVAPAAPPTTGSNGTAQSADPTNNMSVPNSITDETLTLSTGPSFRLDRDLSASVEYSNRFDRNPLPGSVEQEQRVSVSLKGSF